MENVMRNELKAGKYSYVNVKISRELVNNAEAELSRLCFDMGTKYHKLSAANIITMGLSKFVDEQKRRRPIAAVVQKKD